MDQATASRGSMDASQTAQWSAARGAAPLVKSRTQGPVRFPPFEHVSAPVMQEVAAYHITSFGQIQQSSEHIPYNSTKKNFYETTGRESIEAFKYEFRLPGQQISYKVMWDYNIGLVRMTPFFKCLGYPKPSQMLDKNPGLRDISLSITGGSVSAQGYWMPYRCARAVCATFCHEIAVALIPLFGPNFPAECTPPDSQFFGDMVIDHQLIVEATVQAGASRRAYESGKDAALRASASQRRLEGGPCPRPVHANSWLGPPRPLARAAPRMADRSPPHDAGLSACGQANLRMKRPRDGAGGNFPSTGHLNREHPPFRPTYHLQVPSSPRRAAMGPEAAAEPWPMKRPRPEQECTSDAYAPPSAKAARKGTAPPSPAQRRSAAHDSMHKARVVRNAREDYAAAAVLVGLQTTDATTAADVVMGGRRSVPPRHPDLTRQ